MPTDAPITLLQSKMVSEERVGPSLKIRTICTYLCRVSSCIEKVRFELKQAFALGGHPTNRYNGAMG
jgi:hypothetical protein